MLGDRIGKWFGRGGPGAPVILHSEWVVVEVAAGEKCLSPKGQTMALASSICQCQRKAINCSKITNSLTDAPSLTNRGGGWGGGGITAHTKSSVYFLN